MDNLQNKLQNKLEQLYLIVFDHCEYEDIKIFTDFDEAKTFLNKIKDSDKNMYKNSNFRIEIFNKNANYFNVSYNFYKS